MKAQLIEGGAGSGKTYLLVQKAIESAPESCLIIAPDRITASELKDLLPGFKVLTVRELCLEILGDPPRLRLVSSQEALGYLRSLLSSETLRLRSSYERVRSKPTFAKEFLELIELLELNEIDVHELLRISGDEKAEDLISITEAFRDLLEVEGKVLEADLPRLALSHLDDAVLIPPHILVDKLERFSPAAYSLIREISAGRRITAAVDGFMDVSHLSKRFIGELRPEIIRLTDQHRLPSPVTSLLERLTLGGTVEGEGGITLLWEKTVFDEIEAVAIEMLNLMDGGNSPEEMAIVVRDKDSMWPIIADILGGYRIPCFRADLGGGEGVSVMSAEEAAGEFETVFVVELASERFPMRYPSRQILHGEEMEAVRAALRPYGIPGAMSPADWYQHEKLLLCSAISRCKGQLFLSFAEDYVANLDCKPSPFLVEITGDEEMDAERCHQLGINLERYRISSGEGLRSTAKLCLSLNKTIFSSEGLDSLPERLPETAIEGVGERRFSHSSIRDYLSCPRWFFFGNLLRLPSEKPSRVKFGRIIHDKLRDLHVKFPEMDRADPETLLRYVLEGLEEEFDPSQFESALERLGYIRLAEAILRGYVRWIHENWSEDRRTILCEGEFSWELSGFRLSGKLDRVDQLGDGGHEIIDYKTSSAPNLSEIKRRFMNLKDDPNYRAEDYQLPIYYFGVIESLGLEVSALTLFYLQNLMGSSDPERKFEVGEKEREELSSVKEGLANTLREISSGFYPPDPRDDFTCTRCPFSFICSRR